MRRKTDTDAETEQGTSDEVTGRPDKPEAGQSEVEALRAEVRELKARLAGRTRARREPQPVDEEEQAERFERAFTRGGSVLVGGQVYERPEDLP